MRETRIVVLVVSLLCSITAAESPKVNVARIEQRILELSQFGKNPEGGVSRVAFSDADIAERKYIVSPQFNRDGTRPEGQTYFFSEISARKLCRRISEIDTSMAQSPCSVAHNESSLRKE